MWCPSGIVRTVSYVYFAGITRGEGMLSSLRKPCRNAKKRHASDMRKVISRRGAHKVESLFWKKSDLCRGKNQKAQREFMSNIKRKPLEEDALVSCQGKPHKPKKLKWESEGETRSMGP